MRMYEIVERPDFKEIALMAKRAEDDLIERQLIIKELTRRLKIDKAVISPYMKKISKYYLENEK